MAEASKTETTVGVFPQCDLCNETAHYDAATKFGPWAYLCDAHYAEHGVGLGTGKGQRLVVRVENPTTYLGAFRFRCDVCQREHFMEREAKHCDHRQVAS